MINRSDFRRFARRMAVCLAVALVFVAVISEVAFLFQKEDSDRPPQVVEIVVPEGTAERAAAGVATSSIPTDLTLVLGDTLQVRNDDVVDHQIGPVWVPPGSTARIEMTQPDKYAYACSFQPSRYLGLDVRTPTTLRTRLTGLGLAVPPTTMFLFFYSLLLFPIRRAAPESENPALQPAAGHKPREAGD